ncbi:hypothetical protein ACFPPD_08955 [Cohnella suwonensis]|uniref:Glycosyl transferase n=1 Tax=Cohnella suwonensis TaxID=696072 RepID=A0ABW0LU62_9BACL
MIICTVTAANHLAFAKVLAKSANVHVKGSKVVLCLMENQIHPEATGFYDVVLIKDLGIPNVDSHIANKNIYELSQIIKPYLLQYAFNRYGEETKFVYLDADSRVYSSFEEIDNLLDRQNIVLTPHRVKPQNHPNAITEELVNLKDGVFQVGFIGLSKTTEAQRFLKWWAARCHDYAIVDRSRGLFGDQKWLNLVPCFFKGVYILREPAYHVASWNLSQRKLKRDPELGYTVGGKPLVFFHFSGMGKWLDKSIALHASKNGNVQNLVNEYKLDLKNSGYDDLINILWDFEKILRHEANQQPVVKPPLEQAAIEEPLISEFVQEPDEEEESEPVIVQRSEPIIELVESAPADRQFGQFWNKGWIISIWDQIKALKTALINKFSRK